MAVVFYGQGKDYVFGQRVTLWELRNVLPPAKWYKLRIRPKCFTELFAKNDDGIRRYYVKKLDSGAFELVERASNERKITTD